MQESPAFRHGEYVKKKQAYELLKKYNKQEFHLQHARTVSLVMRYFAFDLGYEDEADFWEIVGLLHDIDFEMYPEEHCQKAVEILSENGADNLLIHAVCCHGYGICSDVKPEHTMEKVLFATDELTGLIGAAALMRPSKSVQDMELKSLKKKFKDKKFAAGCSCDIIKQGAKMLDWELDDLLKRTLDAMKAVETKINDTDF
ncbi:hydrolase [Megamonas hypermegale]|nr:hydrolase [Megamonas hypermegale]